MQQKSQDLLNKTFIYALGNFGSKILGFGLLPLYSYFLSQEEFGYYDLIVTTMTLLVPLVTLQISEGIFRWLLDPSNDVDQEKSIVTNGLLLVILNILILSIVGILLGFFHPLKFHYFLILLLITSSIFPVVQQTVRGFGKTKLYAKSGFLYSLLLLAATLILLYILSEPVLALLIATISANITATIYLIWKADLLYYCDYKLFSKSKTFDMMKYSWPLIPNTISWWLVNSANKYLILIYLGTAANGIFAFSSRLPGILIMINSIFNIAWQDSVIKNFSDPGNRDFFQATFKKLSKIYISIAVLLILYSRNLIDFLLSDSFFEAWKYMPFLVLAVVSSALAGFYGSFYLAEKKTKPLVFSTLLGGVLNVLLTYIFIEQYGLYAVALSTFLGFLSIFIYRSFAYHNLVTPTMDIKLLLLVPASLVIIYTQSQLINQLIIFLTLILFWFNRKDIIQLYKFLITKKKKILTTK